MAEIDGLALEKLLAGGMAAVRRKKQELNDLNVFPIPDGDTGDNLCMTLEGGMRYAAGSVRLDDSAAAIARGMLLGARGNSGVIFSQWFAGIAEALAGAQRADGVLLARALEAGTAKAYAAVATPAEGTILTVARESAAAAPKEEHDPELVLRAFVREAEASLQRTPDLLPILKEAGVVDSGGKGLLIFAGGMLAALTGEEPEETLLPDEAAPAQMVDIDAFTEDSVLEFGYCTELLLRLQRAKGDPERFDLDGLRDWLNEVGNSVVLFRTGSVVKMHVHTEHPGLVLEHCRSFGEFLTVKIENMQLQHNETLQRQIPEAGPRKARAVVAVASGDGLREAFEEFGADEVISGGQTQNPSAQDFLDSFRRVNAETVFVLPNNGNVLLAARQAAELCTDCSVRVIPTKSIGDGWAVLSLMEPMEDPDEMERVMLEAMEGVETAEISQSVRDAVFGGRTLREGTWLGIRGKELLAAEESVSEAVLRTAEALHPEEHGILLLIRGEQAGESPLPELEKRYPGVEIYETEGGQPVFPWILVAE